MPDLGRVESASPDLLPNAAQQRLSLRAHQLAPDRLAAAGAPTLADVGDINSFGRTLKWLGVMQGNVVLLEDEEDCLAAGTSSTSCVVTAPVPAVTNFDLKDIAHVSLPGKSAHSLLCYWFSPYFQAYYYNPTSAPVVAQLEYEPSLTIESTVLDDPSMIDPTTGLAFNGKLVTYMSSTENVQVPLSAGQLLDQRTRDSNVCIAGFLTKRSLVEMYGLTERQANRFFNKPMTVRMNIRGNAQYVPVASLTFGMRIVGD